MTIEPAQTFDSLRDYLTVVEEQGHLKRIEGAHWRKEIGALTETVAFSDSPKTLLFDSIKGYNKGKRVVTNLYNTEFRQALALGLPVDLSGVELVESWRKKTAKIEPIPPQVVSNGSICENIITGEEVNLFEFPVPLWHEHDGGRYFGTGDVTFTRQPEGDWVNAAPYRIQLHDEKTLGLLVVQIHHGAIQMQEYWERGEDAPIVITGGQSPYVFASACIPFPKGYSELNFAGGLRGEPIDVIIHEETGLPVLANAEIAVIGHVPPPEEETHLEGPFGECAGYYAGGKEERPVIHVDEIWHRKNPILQGNPTMQGSAMRHALGAELVTSARIWDAIDDDVPAIQGVYSLYQPCQMGSSILAVSIEQQYAGHARQTALAAMGSQAAINMNRAVVVVDEDIDPSVLEEVLFAFTTRCDPAEDIDIVRGIPSSGLDARIHPHRNDTGDLTNSTMLINACKPYHWKSEFPITNAISDDLRQKMIKKWDIDEWQ